MNSEQRTVRTQILKDRRWSTARVGVPGREAFGLSLGLIAQELGERRYNEIMKTLWQVAVICMAALALFWVGGIVVGIVGAVLHYALILAIVGGVVYVGYSLANPRKSLGWKSRILP